MEVETKTPVSTTASSPDASSGPPVPRPSANRPMRIVFLILGVFFLVLGIIGIFLPVMPTTIWLIVAAGFFARSDPRLESWLLNHPRFGNTLRNWRTEGSIASRHKVAALATLWPSIIITSFFVPRWAAAVVIACAVGVTIYILTRPSPAAAP